MQLKSWITTTFNLGIAAAVGLVLAALALQDIAHGESDLRTEWWALRISLLLIAVFIAAALRTLTILRRTARA